ncbi:GspH/FimT family protein [Desulfomicrobium salsuginis]
MDSNLQHQKGVTLVELLVVVGILGVLGAVTGLFLLKYLPEYNLRAAANTLSQDLRTTQMNALKRFRPWAMDFDTGAQSYSIIDSGADGNLDTGDDVPFKTVNLLAYGGSIRFGSGTSARVRFSAEGMGSGNATVTLRNSAGTMLTTTVLRTGAIRVN